MLATDSCNVVLGAPSVVAADNVATDGETLAVTGGVDEPPPPPPPQADTSTPTTRLAAQFLKFTLIPPSVSNRFFCFGRAKRRPGRGLRHAV